MSSILRGILQENSKRTVKSVADEIANYIGDSPSDSAIVDAVEHEAKIHGFDPSKLFDAVYDHFRHHIDENLHKWFKEKWVRFGPAGQIDEDFDWQNDPMQWQGDDKDTTQYNGFLKTPVKMSVTTGIRYFIKEFNKTSPTTATLRMSRSKTGGWYGVRNIDFNALAAGQAPERFWVGNEYITPEEAFNLFQLQKHKTRAKKEPKKQNTIWEPLDEAKMSDVVVPLVREFNLEHGGSERWSHILPLHTVSSSQRWRRGDGSYYTDPNSIEAFDQSNPEQRQLQSEFYDWLIQKPGVKNIGEVSGEFRSDRYAEAAKYKGVIFVKRGYATQYFTPSKLRNSSVWNKKNDNNQEKAPKQQNTTWEPLSDSSIMKGLTS